MLDDRLMKRATTYAIEARKILKQGSQNDEVPWNYIMMAMLAVIDYDIKQLAERDGKTVTTESLLKIVREAFASPGGMN
jgi:hypothetical protein